MGWAGEGEGEGEGGSERERERGRRIMMGRIIEHTQEDSIAN